MDVTKVVRKEIGMKELARVLNVPSDFLKDPNFKMNIVNAVVFPTSVGSVHGSSRSFYAGESVKFIFESTTIEKED